MVTVKVRETYDLHTVQNKMTVIGIHTPKPDIIKKNFPGLLMQCKMYRPKSCNVKVACASVLPLDPLGVGTEAGDVAPEDMFNPILYGAMSNKGMSQLEARINAMRTIASGSLDVEGNSADVDVDTFTSAADEFDIYYGILSNAYGFRKASPMQGIVMTDLQPLVYEMVYNVGDMTKSKRESVPEEDPPYDAEPVFASPSDSGLLHNVGLERIVGKAKPFPFINCTSYSGNSGKVPGFDVGNLGNNELDVPYLNVICGAIIIPPSRLHSLYYRMIVDWQIEFSSIRPLAEVTNWGGLQVLGQSTHYQNYSYESAKKAICGDDSESILDNDSCMVSANVEIDKVM